jgi:hypothetical protein
MLRDFEEGTDIYWGRTRVLEYMSKITGQLPEGVAPKLGPDATGVGWAFQYALVDKSGRNNLQQMRSFNDWYLRYWLSSVPGVAEVATIGGFVKQYQVNVDPNRLLAYKVPLTQVMDAVRNGNGEVGARSLEMTGKEYMVRGRGYIQKIADIQNLLWRWVTTAHRSVCGTLRVSNSPDMRRGIVELNGEGGDGWHRRGPVRAECAGSDPASEEQAGKGEVQHARGSGGRHHLRPLGSNRSVNRYVAAYVNRRVVDRQHRHSDFPLAHSQRDHPDPHHPDRRDPGLYSHAGDWHDREHHAPAALRLPSAMVDASSVVVEQTHKKLEHWR